MTEKSKILKEDKMDDDFVEYVIEQMRDNFEWRTANWSISKILKMFQDGKIKLPDYQRDDVWPNTKRAILNETVLEYGANQVPEITLRQTEDDTYELVDGRQRVTSLKRFTENDFKLLGSYHQEFKGCYFKDFPKLLQNAFLSNNIKVKIGIDMSYEDAVSYFVRINSSGVNVTNGERIHAMQRTLFMQDIKNLIKHPVWDNVGMIRNHAEYEYVSKMVLFERDKGLGDDLINIYSDEALITEIELCSGHSLPKSTIKSVEKTFDFLNKIFVKNHCSLTIRPFLALFIYVNKNLDELNVSDFGEFISGLYSRMENQSPNTNNFFTTMKNKPATSGYQYTNKYFEWYNEQIDKSYSVYRLKGDWNAISRL